jgi:chorismate mutase-like protein
MADLGDLRQRIDAIDAALVNLLADRMNVCREVAEIKETTGAAVIQPQRVRDVLSSRRQWAIDAGVDAPFSCKGAVCCTCRAKVIEGKAKMDANFALTDAEVEDGFILTCQAHPLTEKLVVDFDAI